MQSFTLGLSAQQRLIAAGILGFIAGVLVTALFFLLQSSQAVRVVSTDDEQQTAAAERPAMQEEEKDETTSATSRGTDRVVVNDQPAGSVVQLASVTLAASSWVAIHEDVDGAPGNVLGAVRLDQGTSQGDVKLLRPTMPGQLYYARIYRDNGDGMFNLKTDPALVNVAGIPIGDIFQTNSR